MRLYFTTLSITALFACGTQHSELATTLDPNDRPYSFIRDLGRGFNTLKDVETQNCAVSDSVEQKQVGEWEDIAFQRVTSIEMLYSFLGLSASATYDPFSSQAQLQRLASHFAFNDKAAIYVLGRFYHSHLKSMSRPQLSENILAISQKQQFLDRCGDRFIGGVKYGFGAVAVLQVPAHSQSDFDAVIAAMADEANRTTFLESRAHIFKTYMRGVNTAYEAGFSGFKTLLAAMNQSVLEEENSSFNSVELRATLVDYHLLDNWHGEFDVSQNSRRSALELLLRTYNEHRRTQWSIDYLNENYVTEFAAKVYVPGLGIQNSLRYAGSVAFKIKQNMEQLSSAIEHCRSYDKPCSNFSLDSVPYIEPVWEHTYEAVDPNETTNPVVVEESAE